MDTIAQAFGDVVRRRREAARLSQEALAAAAGLHRTYISLIEVGKRTPSLLVVHQLARGLRTTMTALVADLEPGGAPARFRRGR